MVVLTVNDSSGSSQYFNSMSNLVIREDVSA